MYSRSEILSGTTGLDVQYRDMTGKEAEIFY
jgi:hypothetical protein